MLFLHRFFRTSIAVTNSSIQFSCGSECWKTILLTDLESITQGSLLGFPVLHITSRENGHHRHTLIHGQAHSIRNELSDYFATLARQMLQYTQGCADAQGAYPTPTIMGLAWKKINTECRPEIQALNSPLAVDQLRKNTDFVELMDLLRALESPGEARDRFIRRHIDTELDAYKQFFDTIESKPLTQEQREACVVADDRQLLVAAAGSGKSSTIVAKVGYLLKKEWVKPEEIVILAFNSDAAKEIKTRCTERLSTIPGIEKITSSTFHAFGKKFLRNLFPDRKAPQVSLMAKPEGQSQRHSALRFLVQEAIHEHPEFAGAFKILQDITKGNDDSPVVEVRGSENQNPLLTLKGDIVKSQQERQIADFLFSYGICYEYERSYEFDVSDPDHAQYRPDFYFPTIGVYYEHFAINSKGQAPPEFEGYLEKTKWRREIHPKMGTKLFETLSADFEDRSVFDKILYWLHEFGYEFNEDIAPRVVYGSVEMVDPAIATLDQFVANRKLSGITDSKLFEKATTAPRWITRLLPFMTRIADRYQEILTESGEIDFTDMITLATKAINEAQDDLPYRYLLIDEFQDISAIRADMVRALLRKSPGCKLFCVGDDWQSINGFSGSEVRLMTRFHDEFGPGTTQNLTQTFRSNQGIASVAAEFVMRNPEQLKKGVIALDKTDKKVIDIHLMDSPLDLKDILWGILQQVRNKKTGKKTSLYALARYNHFFGLKGKKPNEFEEVHKHWIETLAKEDKGALDVTMETFHRSKGRECDIAILLGMVNEKANKRSFPSRMPEDILTQLPLAEKEPFPDAEERRLFYVALTRARNKLVIPTILENMSPFLKELRNFDAQVTFYRHGSPASRCPSCGDGFTIKEGIQVSCTNKDCELGIIHKNLPCPSCGTGKIAMLSGRNGLWKGCTNYPACR